MELSKALEAASLGIRNEAFYLARNQRRENWQGKYPREDKGLGDLAVPVFEALVYLDVQRLFHRNRAELGYALKDGKEPKPRDYARARDSLTEAIDIRDSTPKGAPFPMYEFNRAFCNIMLGQQVAPDEIAKDLVVAGETGKGLEATAESNEIRGWLAGNQLTPGVTDLLQKIAALG
jgi:hypothetical protein